MSNSPPCTNFFETLLFQQLPVTKSNSTIVTDHAFL